MQSLHYNNIVIPDNYEIALDSDEYINLSLDTSAIPLGVKYVYLGNQASRGQELLELRVDPATMLIRCIVLVCKPPITMFPVFSLDNVVCEKGVPQLSSIEWPAGARHLNLNVRFRISLHERTCILHWGNLNKLSRCAVIGPAKFLLSQDEVLGVLFPDLDKKIVAQVAE